MWQPEKPLGVGEVSIGPLAKKYINEILNTRRVTYGKFSRRFEQEFAKLHGVSHALFCNSGTSALQVSIHALKDRYGWAREDEILVPALGFVATVNTVLQNNLKPVFVDVDPVYFEIDPDKIVEKITKRTKAVIVVHIAGLPADIFKILKICRKYNLKLIEDSCQTVFAKYKSQPVGSFGEISCFSTYSAHILATGVGGFVCTNDNNLASSVRSLINHGRDVIYTSIDDDDIDKTKQLKKIIASRFRFTNIGYSYRLTEFEAALGLAGLKNWKDLIKRRVDNANYLKKGLLPFVNILQLPEVRPDADHVFMVFPLVIRDRKVRREALLLFLEKSKIETRYLFPLLNQPIYEKLFNLKPNNYPVAEKLIDDGFYIGCHEGFGKKELDYIIAKFHEYFKQI